jgi:hypothetical protein
MPGVHGMDFLRGMAQVVQLRMHVGSENVTAAMGTNITNEKIVTSIQACCL